MLADTQSATDATEVQTTVGVYPLVPTRSFDEPLSYLVDGGGTAVPLRVGSLVEIPVGTATRVGVVATAPAKVSGDATSYTLKPVGRNLDIAIPQHMVRLAEWIGDTYGCARTRALSLVVPPKFVSHAKASAVPVRQMVLAVRRIAETESVNIGVLNKRQSAVVSLLSAEWESVATVLVRCKTTRPTLTKLADLGFVEIERRHVDLLALEDLDVEVEPVDVTINATTFQLSQEQIAAVACCENIDGADPSTLLMGVTGSGKTEVYLQLIERALQRGESAIVLVPEIALTPQTARRFHRRFPDLVEVLHSNLTRAQRSAAHERISAGKRLVVVGPRSAIFAPLNKVGVIVIDEEHDNSYKQESEPRYDARRVAWKRASFEGSLLVLGSATPRPESWYGIKRHAVLKQRAAGGLLAPVELVDLRLHGDRYPITEHLQAALDATLRRGRKAIVMHNRRGYATALHCTSCGRGFRCPSCDLALIVHGRNAHHQKFNCHQCGFTTQVPDQCPDCGAADIARLGAGTERVERDLAELFSVPIHRLDADAARTEGVHEILSAFSEPGPAILTGTQMVAKGHDFADVELAAVIDSDTALAIPDFRAEERAFNLVAQLAGRAGRSSETAEHARVLVQTWDPESEFLSYAVRHDVDGFLTREIARRKQHDYPPFSRLVRVLISARDAGQAHQWSQVVAEGLRALDAGAVLGPTPLVRIADRYREQAVLKTKHAAAVATSMRGFLRKSASQRSRADIRIVLDVDPQTMI